LEKEVEKVDLSAFFNDPKFSDCKLILLPDSHKIKKEEEEEEEEEKEGEKEKEKEGEKEEKGEGEGEKVELFVIRAILSAPQHGKYAFSGILLCFSFACFIIFRY